jgi:hypothetical protein
MRIARWLITLLIVLSTAATGQAQGIIVWGVGGFGDPGLFSHKHHHLVYRADSPYRTSYLAPPYCYPVTRASFFQPVTPIFVGPPSWLGMALVQERPLLDADPPTIVAMSRPRRVEPPPLWLPMDPGEPASVFRPILPEDRARVQQPEQPAMPAKKPPPAPEPKAPLVEPKPLPRPRQPDANPKVESLQQIRLGREAFAAQEYGRAERRFQQAVQVLPQDAHAYFLLAQAQFALGKYAEAVSSIHAGMRLQVNWPSALFWPRDLYESNVDDYNEHLKNLARALSRYPDDPALLFLQGYELWFDDKRDEAKPFFVRAAARATDASFSRQFVPAQP